MDHKGVITQALTDLVDIYPTIAELCDLKVPSDQLDGKSVVPILQNPNSIGKKHVLIKKGNGFTIKTSDYSYTEFLSAENSITISSMLYDHRYDRDENINVSDNLNYLRVKNRLKRDLHNYYSENLRSK